MIPTTKIKQATLITHLNGDPAICIQFSYRPQLVQVMHKLTGKRWHPEPKYWTADVTIQNLELLSNEKFMLDSKLNTFLEKYREREPIHVDSMDATMDIQGLRGELYPYQGKGVSFINEKNGRALIADEMGLGKTIQALAWLQLHPEKRPVIIVTPASVKLNWRKEARIWMDNPRVAILSGRNHSDLPKAEIFIVNYDILHSWIPALKELEPQVIITDECHFYKNNKAKRTKAVKKLAKGVPHFIALSGTPLVNRPAEIHNAAYIIDPITIPPFWEYARLYCNLRNDGFGWKYDGATRTRELHELLTTSIMIRRLKMDVLKDLPPKTRAFVPMELANRQEYMQAEFDFIDFLRAQKGAAAAERASKAEYLVKVGVMKQLAAHGKLNHAITWIKDFLEVEDKLVVFAHHKAVIDRLMEEFGDIAVKIDGSVSNEKRQDVVDAFQEDPKIKLFIGNIRAAGIGITLTAASNAAIIELPWTPGELVQAEDRIHRIGQDEHVTIHYLLAEDTIDEHSAGILDKKAEVLNAVLDGETADEENLLTELIRIYESKID